jgi:NADPH-dependent glutamate synthase beta subunit-like oxidoreductase
MSMSRDEIQEPKPTFRKFRDGDHDWRNWREQIFEADHSHKCPTYVLRTPPCQGGCPAGEEIRGYLQIVRGIEHPSADMGRQEYAFRRLTDANPFPSVMGRVCPAPCQDACNRNDVDDFVGINAVEQFIGDTAISENFAYAAAPALSDKKVAIIGGGPAGLSAAYHLRRRGHASTIFDEHDELGGMMRYGLPRYRMPRDVLDREIQRILDLGGIEVRTGTRVGRDVSSAEVEKEFDALIWALGCQAGRPLPAHGADAPNCVTGIKFLEAFNTGRLKIVPPKIVCVGGGDTSIDVVSVARRLGCLKNGPAGDLPERVIEGSAEHGEIPDDARTSADVTLTSLFPKNQMTAAEHEVRDAIKEGVKILDEVMPLEVLLDANGRARGLRMARCDMVGDRPVPKAGTEFELECDLIVSAIGQGGDLAGIDDLNNGHGLIDSDKFYQVPNHPGHFVAGDIIRPHLLTTAIGQASIAAETVDQYLHNAAIQKRPKVDKHRFNLLDKLREAGLEPEEYDHQQKWGTASGNFAVHNFEDRSAHEIIPSSKLFLGHFPYVARLKRREIGPTADEVIGHFMERTVTLNDEQAQEEAKRCMSCGLCFECDNCVIYCPQNAVFRVKKDRSTTGRYVDTDYARCIGCHICSDVCPTGYIDMALGG